MCVYVYIYISLSLSLALSLSLSPSFFLSIPLVFCFLSLSSKAWCDRFRQKTPRKRARHYHITWLLSQAFETKHLECRARRNVGQPNLQPKSQRSFSWWGDLSGPLDRLNAILSLLQPLDRYRTPSAIGSAIGRPLSRPISHMQTQLWESSTASF